MGKLRSRDWERVVRILMVFSFSVMALVVPIVVVLKAKNSGTSIPTSAPSSVPSDVPSEVPTRSPTAPPSGIPSANPSSLPSIGPSPAPTMVYFDTNPVPPNPPRGYFNYDTNDTEYGPSRWNRVDTSNHPIREFGRNGFGPWKGHLSDDPARNQCGGPDRRQSPKNLVGTIECDAHHEIRTWCGSKGWNDDDFETNIFPHKLSFKMNRRPCVDVRKTACQTPNPPNADYPRYSSSITSYSDLITYDLKIPGEHTIEGESFDAEIQMLHVHPIDERVSSIGVMVKVGDDPTNSYNAEFQSILDRFQSVYDAHALECNRSRERNLRKKLDLDLQEFEVKSLMLPNTAQLPHPHGSRFDPYSDALMPTIFFYRYDGSITEPPCKDITWWVMSKPVIIAAEQLDQLKQILFTHVDSNCRPTSVHNSDQKVARPIYPLGEDRTIQACTDGSFRSDFDKRGNEGKKCKL